MGRRSSAWCSRNAATPPTGQATSTSVTGSASGSTSAMNGAARRFKPNPMVPCTSDPNSTTSAATTNSPTAHVHRRRLDATVGRGPMVRPYTERP